MRKLRNTPDPVIEGMEYADPEVRKTFGAQVSGDLIPPASVALVLVVSGVLLHNDHVLLQQRAPHREYPLTWETPGGKVEPGEHPEDALRREWSEELDLSVRVGRWLAAFTFDTPVVVRACAVGFYVVQVSEDAYRPKLLDAVGVGWFTYGQAIALPLTPGTAAFLRDARDVCGQLGLKP